MWTHGQKQSATRLLIRRVILLGLLILVAFSISAVWGVLQKERESAARRAEAEHERADLLERQTQLESDIAALRSDRGLEAALREQYALAEAGERLIVIVDPPTPALLKATSTIIEKIRSIFWFW